MSKGGSGGGGVQTVQTQTQLPDWVNSAARDNLDFARSVADNLAGPYTGQRVAPLTAGTGSLTNMLLGNVGAGNNSFTQAGGTLSALQNYNPLSVSPNSLAQTDLTPYLNKYTQDVVDKSLNSLEIQRKQAINSVGDQAASAKAFGGSRHGVVEGVTNAEAARHAGELTAGLQQANFGQAQAAAGQDIATNLQGQIANQNADATGAGVRLSGANSGATVAAQGQQTLLQQIMAGLQGQQLVQGNQQAQLDAAKALYDEQRQYPIQQLQIRSGTLAQTPYGSTTTQQTALPGGNGLMQGAGLAMGGLGLMGSLFGASGAFPLVGASSLLSDRTEKTDIKKLGVDEETGLDIYAYRYKGDPKTYPKVVGPMAQDVAKKFPHLAGSVAGRLTINLPRPNGLSAGA
jgi:hypothetical protein